MQEYRCARCKEPIRIEIDSVGLQCRKCGSKIFYKDRPSTKKVVKAR